MEKRGASVEKQGAAVDALFTEINDLGRRAARIHGFLNMPVPFWRAQTCRARLALDCRDFRRPSTSCGRRPAIAAPVDELEAGARSSSTSAGRALPYSGRPVDQARTDRTCDG